MDDDELIAWQDVLDEIAAGRGDDLICPMCGQRPLAVEERPSGSTRISCPRCRKFIEGKFALQ